MPDTIPTDLVAPLFNPATFGIRGAVDEVLRQVRSEYPLSVAEVPGFDPHWIVSRHADVAEVSKRNDVFVNSIRSATLVPTLGQHLARMEMQCLWEELLPRLDSVSMAGEGKLIHSEFVSGPKSVPIEFLAT